MIINKKIKRTMLENKAQYIGSLFLIIISCLLYTMFNQLSDNMANLTSSFEKNYVQEDASFISDKELADTADLETKYNMLIEETKTIDYAVSKDKTLRIFSENTKVDLPAIVQGSSLTDGGILIDPAYAKANKLNVGDTIKIYGKDFKINGFMSLPNYIYPLKAESDLLNDSNLFGIAVINKADFNSLNKGNSSYTIRFNGDKSNIDNRIAEFKDTLRSLNVIILKWTNISENPRVTYVSAKLDGINKMSSSMPIAILLLTCILTGVVMWRMLKRESIIIGTLYALGYKKKEIVSHYLFYPLSIAIIGGAAGTILGALTLRPMLNFMIAYFNVPLTAITFNIQYVITSILLPVIFLGVSGYFVVRKALKNSPVELMRGGKEDNKVGFIEKRLKLNKLKFKAKFRVREQLRSIPRSIFLLLGVMMATMLLLFGFAAKSSMEFMMKDSYEGTFKYQNYYMFNSLQRNNPFDGEAYSLSPFTLKSDSKTAFSVYGINSDTKYISLKDKAGSNINTDKIIITRPLADRLKVKPQDTIEVINKLDSRPYDIKIDSIAETYAGDYTYMPLDEFNAMLNYPRGSFMGLWSDRKLNIPENMLLSAGTSEDLKNAFNAATAPLQYAMGIMSFISFIIGLIVIYVVTSLIIEENKENISLMKVLGYRKKEVYSLILNSSWFLVVFGYILGVPLLLASLTAMFGSITKSMNFTFPIKIGYSYLIIGFVVIYLTYEVSKLLSRKKVNKISMTEALKTQLE